MQIDDSHSSDFESGGWLLAEDGERHRTGDHHGQEGVKITDIHSCPFSHHFDDGGLASHAKLRRECICQPLLLLLDTWE